MINTQYNRLDIRKRISVWIPRVYSEDKDPVICPKCKSPYWNKPKVAAKK